MSTVALTALLAFPGLASAKDLDCGDFRFQEDAQAELDKDRSDPHRLDALGSGQGDGIACERLPRRGGPVGSDDESDRDSDDGPTVVAASDDEDRDCPDFPSQAAAQAALEANPSDTERLDRDDDGIACEDHFGDDNRQVSVRPRGGVDTGGSSDGV